MFTATLGLPEGRSGSADTWDIVNPFVSLGPWTSAIQFQLNG